MRTGSVLHVGGWFLALAVLSVARLGAVEYRLYWGDVHTHTSLSDGTGTVAQLLAYARDVAHLDFVIVTDHDFGNGHPWRMSPETWKAIQDAADAYTVEGRFVAIAGYEWTSQAKYWTEVGPNQPSERLFPGPPSFYNHKNVYFPGRVEHLFSAKDLTSQTPDLLVAAVLREGGLIQNNHPDRGSDGRDQWAYAPRCSAVIANTELSADTLRYQGKVLRIDGERLVREFLNRGGKTGFVKGTDTHEGKPAARTAVLATQLTRQALFDALRQRRNYAVSQARIVVDFRVSGQCLGEEVVVQGQPEITATVTGTAPLAELVLIRDGLPLHAVGFPDSTGKLAYRDDTFQQASYYYVRVTQRDADEHGNPSYAWSSPIWVTRKP